jgi:integral membrane protein (TIGR01906 family)
MMEEGMKRFLTGLCCAAGSALLIIALLILSVEAFAVNQSFFTSEYDKLDTAKSIGMSSADLGTVTKNLLGYTTGSRDSLDMQAVINGAQREVFDDREKDHMVDVKALYLSARDVRTFCLIGATVLFILAFAISRGRALKTLFRYFLSVSGVFVVIIAAIAIYAAVDFTNFWISFHKIFFTNELWQLDPYTEVLINMVPEQFFSDLVMSIIACFVSIFAALNITALIGNHIIKKRSRISDNEA